MDVETKLKALKASWVSRIINTDSNIHKIVTSFLHVFDVDIDYILQTSETKLKDFDLVKNLLSFHFSMHVKGIWSIHIFIPTLLCSKQFGTTNMYVTKEKLFSLEIELKVVLRPYVRRKSDLPLYIGQIHAFYFETTPYTLNDTVNTKSI